MGRIKESNPAFSRTTTCCRSEHAREKPKGAAGCLVSRVIVHGYREHARSYREQSRTANRTMTFPAPRPIMPAFRSLFGTSEPA
ncbi:hypothetical protein PG5_24020 [Pseudomonas sp. G5(2012)]|nr:hypothetical protein PG5_24020 [Pseudomonas sp. G5(2012)]